MEISRILFPVDFSVESQTPRAEVESLANRFGSSVTLLHVFEVPMAWYGEAQIPLFNEAECAEIESKAKQELDRYAINVPSDRITRTVRQGSPSERIVEFARYWKPDVIVMGTHGSGLFRRMLLGSVTMKVLHDINFPVWTRTPQTNGEIAARAGIRRVLCSLDLSAEAVPLLRLAKESGECFGAAVEIVHVMPGVTSAATRYFDSPLHRALFKVAEEDIAKLQDEAETSFPVTVIDDRVGDVTDIAEQRKADLILIGRGHIQQRLGGWRTHGYDIIRRARCPVLSFGVDRIKSRTSTDETETAES